MAQGQLASIKLTSYAGDVYEPSDDSFLLADALLEVSKSWTPAAYPKMCMEIGCGSGYVLCSLALMLRNLGLSAHLLATDINPAAATATAATLAAHGLAAAADIAVADLLHPLQERMKGTVDLLLFNPPYVPTPDEEVQWGGIAAAWAGGDRGRRVVDRLLPLLPGLLSSQGEMLLVVVPDNDPQELISLLGKQGLEGRVAMQRSADEEQLQVLHFRRPQQPLPE